VSTTGVEVVDERTYRVKLKSLRYDFDRLSPDPFPEHVEGERVRSAKDPLDYGNKSAFNTAPATLGLWNGPYVLTDFKANESVSFARNPHWDGEPPAFDHVVFRFYASTPAMQAALLAGDIDTVYGYTLDQAIELQKTQAQRFEVTFTPALTTTFLYLNTENPQLADKRVRQAILSGIDRATLVKKLYEDKVPVATSFLSPVEADYAADLPHWPYDPKRARDLLAAAGFKPGADGVMVGADGKRLSLELDVSSGIRIVELVQQVIQSQLKAVGIEIVAKTEPVRVLLGETVRKRIFPAMTMFSWTPAPAAVPYFTYHSGRIPSAANNYDGVNYTGFRNARMDTLLTDALAELDGEKRRAMMHEIQAIVMDELPQLPLYQGANVYVQPRWMSGMVPPRSYSVPTPWIEYWKVR
jgi:peptide/nickel transport system substrate-binding protein